MTDVVHDGLLDLLAAGDAAAFAAGLTEREVEVTRLLCQGLTDGEIAVRLFLSSHTVHDHVRSIRRKLDVRSRTGIAFRIFSAAWPEVSPSASVARW